jgi:acetyl-CoA carboxylase biotin carboxyl carrier protein
LAQWLDGTDIDVLELSGPARHIRLRRGVNAVELQAQPAAPQASPTVVRASSVGVLLHAHPLRDVPLVRTGDAVAAGQPLALLQVGAVLLPVAAPHAGTVARVLAAYGAVVGYGEPLVELA